jgi:hypothetical protein
LRIDLVHGAVKTTILLEELTLTLPTFGEMILTRRRIFFETISETKRPARVPMIVISLLLALQ